MPREHTDGNSSERAWNFQARYLRRGLTLANLRKVRSIQEAADRFVESLGGVDEIRRHFRSRAILASMLTDVEFPEVMARKRMLAIRIPLEMAPRENTSSPDYEGLTVYDVMRTKVAEAIIAALLKKVFPRGQEKPVSRRPEAPLEPVDRT